MSKLGNFSLLSLVGDVPSDVKAKYGSIHPFFELCLSIFFQLTSFLFSGINCCWKLNLYKDNTLLIEKIDWSFSTGSREGCSQHLYLLALGPVVKVKNIFSLSQLWYKSSKVVINKLRCSSSEEGWWKLMGIVVYLYGQVNIISISCSLLCVSRFHISSCSHRDQPQKDSKAPRTTRDFF